MKFENWKKCSHLNPTHPQGANSRLNAFPFPDPPAIQFLLLLDYKCIYGTVKRLSIAGFTAAGLATVCTGHRGKGSTAGQDVRSVHPCVSLSIEHTWSKHQTVGKLSDFSLVESFCSSWLNIWTCRGPIRSTFDLY